MRAGLNREPRRAGCARAKWICNTASLNVERLDIFHAHQSDAPLLVFIHGGYWRSLDKSDFSWIAPPLLQHGVAVALTNYGLAPQTSIEDIVRQQLKALGWLYHNARDCDSIPTASS